MHFLIIGGSDAGISAALRARELDREAVITVVLADVCLAKISNGVCQTLFLETRARRCSIVKLLEIANQIRRSKMKDRHLVLV